MSRVSQHPVVFVREDTTHENYLVVMHYMADLLWQRGCGAQAMEALTALLQVGTAAGEGLPQQRDRGRNRSRH